MPDQEPITRVIGATRRRIHELRQPLGITIVGGLLVSQLLTLFTTPVVYLYMDRLQSRVQRWGAPGAAVEPV